MKCSHIALVLFLNASLTPIAPAADPAPIPAPVTHEAVQFNGYEYDVVSVDLNRADVRLFWKNDTAAIRGLRGLEQLLKKQGESLLFATNAGIYSKDFTPAGLHVENGHELHKINMREGGGNFHLMPNGVFYVDAEGAHVLETAAYRKRAPQPIAATQSGPMLVVDNALHPKFQADSESLYLRSGVGVRSLHEVVFVISRKPVNFHAFATVFKDRLACPNALYLDGQISRFYMPGVLEDSGPALYVGMLAVVAKAPEDHDASISAPAGTPTPKN
jgi:uncharacterized protein YigE (DUF2233 family)